jgi:hypothetical protein
MLCKFGDMLQTHFFFFLILIKYACIITTTTIIACKTAFMSHNLHYKTLSDLSELNHPVFTSLDFATIIYFTEQGCQPCVQLPTWRIRSLYLLCPLSERVAQLHPQAAASLFLTFYDLQGYSGGILTHLHTGYACIT